MLNGLIGATRSSSFGKRETCEEGNMCTHIGLPKRRCYCFSLETLAIVAFLSNSPAKIDDESC